MALTIQSTDLITTAGTAFTVAANGDDLFLRQGVLIASTRGDGIRSGNDDNTITIAGDVFATSTGIEMDGDRATVVITSTGSVLATGDTAGNFGGIELGGVDCVLLNAGEVSSTEGIGVTLNGNNGYIHNTGSIYSASQAVFMGLFGKSDGRLVNDGVISTAGAFASLSDRYGNGVFTEGANTQITNTGEISTSYDDGAGVRISFGGTNSSVLNIGSIVASTGFGVDFDIASSLINAGTIFGGVNSVSGSNQVDSVINRGLMIGDVDMGDDNDLYYGRYGAVEGDIFLGAGNDTASGGAEGERIEGGDGIDRIFGFGGDDNLFGDEGNDVLRGGDGNDGVNGGADNDDLGGGNGNDTLLGADGNDLLRGDMGADVLNGGDGFDRASYGDSSTGITIDLADTGLSTGIAQGDSYVSIEAYEATAFADVMFGDDVNNLLRGMDGDDQISGRGGNDNLQGFDGDDILSGGTGNDTLNGGDGDDLAAFTGDLADYTFTLLGNGNIRVEDTVGNDGVDVLIAVEFVTFGGGAEIDVTGLI